MDVKVDVFTFCWNEMEIIPFAVDYWKLFATHVTVFDNGSTDGSAEYLSQFDFIDVVPFDMGGGMDDVKFAEKKNNCWKDSKADFVVVCDMDEFLYAPNIKKKLMSMKERGVTICEPLTYFLISEEYPKYTKGKLLHEISPLFFEGTTKAMLFNPKAITEINYTEGAHHCSPKGRVSWSNELFQLHVDHNLSLEYKLEKYKKLNARRSERNVKLKLGIHYSFGEEQLTGWYKNMLTIAVDINKVFHKGGRVAAMALCRLGNQMFIAAAARTFAKRTGREFWGLVYTENANDYPHDQMRIMHNVRYVTMGNVAGYYHVPYGGYLCNGFPEVDEDNVLLCDYFQDARCIDRDVALDLFRPYNSILEEIKGLYGDLSEYVCVNVRRGDYLERGNPEIGFRTLSKKDIQGILQKYFPKDKVLFVSDDIDWCKNNFKGKRYLFADKPCRYKPEMDLYLQTQCKANVISNSTFSWWGAYLNEKAEKVVCPWPWFKDNQINTMDTILPEGWVKYE